MAKLLDQFIRSHNLRPVVFHSLRHSSVSLKLSMGGDIKAVQGDTGHSQSNMVTDLYAHTNLKDRQRLAMMVDQNFFEKTKSAPQLSAASFSPEVARIAEMLENRTDMAAALLSMLQAIGASKQSETPKFVGTVGKPLSPAKLKQKKFCNSYKSQNFKSCYPDLNWRPHPYQNTHKFITSCNRIASRTRLYQTVPRSYRNALYLTNSTSQFVCFLLAISHACVMPIQKTYDSLLSISVFRRSDARV